MMEQQSENNLRLKEREARLGRILNNSVNEIYIFDANNYHFIEVNEGARQNLEFSPEEFSQHTPLDLEFSQLTPLDLMPEFTADSFEQILQPLRDDEIEHINLETVIRRMDGSLYPVEVRLQLFATDVNPVFVAVMQDITERKLIQQALHDSEERFNLAMLGANDGLWDWNVVTNSVYFSPRWKAMLGYQEWELENNFDVWAENLHPDDLPAMLKFIDDYLNDPAMDFNMEFRMRHKAGHYVDILARGIGIRDENNQVQRLVGTHVDITERKNSEKMLRQRYEELEQAHRDLKDAQAQLLQSEKMASIGQLAAGVAHEINNPVGYVSSNMSSLKIYLGELFQLVTAYTELEKELPDSEMKQALITLKEKLDIEFLKQDVEDLVDESLEGVHRVKKIVQDLKDFSHVDEAEWQYGDLHIGLDSTLNIVHNELKYKAEVIKEYGDIPKVVCMASQLNQVFMNLLINASHAIEEKGKVFVRTGQHDDEWVWVEIEDTGKGISPEDLEHIFEPFFTTKEVGKGTGLGLSLTYGIIEKHHGRIDVVSNVGVGTRFRIWLPIENDEIEL